MRRTRGNSITTGWRNMKALAAAAVLGLFAAACGSDTTRVLDRETKAAFPPAQPAVGTASNGLGQCLGYDAVDAGYLQNLAPTDLNCTSNDVDISQAAISYYLINGVKNVGPYTALTTGQRIACVPGDVIHAITFADIQNSAQERYDLGLWINPTGSALTGGGDGGTQCTHYNLVVGATGVSNLDLTPDQCGDLGGTALVTIPLDTLDLVCPGGGATTVTVNACAAWSNSTTGSADRICPANPPGGALGFRYGTTPGTTAKCRCQPLDLPIDVKGVLRIHKVTVPSPDLVTSFAFVTTGTDYAGAFSLKDGETNSSGPLSAGTYTATETVGSTWVLSPRACVLTGTATAKTFTSITDGVSVDLLAGEDVTCTFTNTKKASIAIQKQSVGGTATFDFVGTGSPVPASFSRNTGTANPTAEAAWTVLPADFGIKYAQETVPAGWTLTGISCTANGATIVIGRGGSGAFVNGGTDGFDAGDNTVKITVGAGNSPTCTFTNTKDASLDIEKISLGGVGQFDYTGTGSGVSSSFSRTTTTPGVSTATTPFAISGAQLGDKYVQETVPAGYALTNISCTAGGATVVIGRGGSGAFVNGGTDGFDAGDNTVKVTVGAGNTPACTFTNTKGGSLTIIKDAVPNDAQDFSYTASGDGMSNFSLDDDADATLSNSRAFTGLQPGSRTVTEGAVSGWTTTNIACTGATSSTVTIGASGGFDAGDMAVTVDLAAGENVSCTFTNTKDASLAIQKATVGGTGSFDFVGTGSPVPASFSRNTGAANPTAAAAWTIVPGDLGDKYVQETVPTGWALTNIVCTANGATVVIGSGGSGAFVQGATTGFDAGDNTVKVSVGAGNTPTCTFTNSKLPTLELRKTIIGSSTMFYFDVTAPTQDPAVPASITITPASNSTASAAGQPRNIIPGSYTISENLVTPGTPGWLLTDMTCTGVTFTTPTATSVAFTADYGQTIVCTFTNNQQGGGTTRTQGFWATHTALTDAIWNGTPLPPGTSTITPVPVAGGADAKLCGASDLLATTAPGTNEVLGGFWANIAKTSTNVQRNSLDKFRMQMLQQYLAAVLNVHAFGTPLPAGASLADARTAYCGTDITAINNYKSILAGYNEQFDSGAFTPGASATPNLSRSQANIPFWNVTYQKP